MLLVMFTACGVESDDVPPGPVTDVIAIPESEAVLFTWTNPDDPDFDKVFIEGTTAKGNFTSAYSASKAISVKVDDLENNEEYQFTVYAMDKSKNLSTGYTVKVMPTNENGPAVVKNFSVLYGEETAFLSWTNPKDAKFQGVFIKVINNDMQDDSSDSEAVLAELSASLAETVSDGEEENDEINSSDNNVIISSADESDEESVSDDVNISLPEEKASGEQNDSSGEAESESESSVMPEENTDEAEGKKSSGEEEESEQILSDEEIAAILKTEDNSKSSTKNATRVQSYFTKARNITEYTVTGLKPGTSYTFVIYAYDIDNRFSEEVSETGTVPLETEGLRFRLSDDGESYTLIEYTGDNSANQTATPESEKGIVSDPIEVTVFSTHKGKPVTAIGSQAFKNCRNVTKVNLPSTIKQIRTNAFEGCTGLTGMTIPSGTVSILDGAFWNCSNLEWIVIPSSVKSIGLGATMGASKLSHVFYTGTEEEWEELQPSIKNGNIAFTRSDSRILRSNVEIRFEYDGISPIDLIAPDNVSELNADAGYEHVVLSWTNPSDEDFAGVRIAVKKSFEEDYYIFVPSAQNSCIISDLENGKQYTFAISTFDKVKNYSDEKLTQKLMPDLVEKISEEGIRHYINSDAITCTVLGVQNETSLVNIPSFINSQKVTAVADGAFADSQMIEMIMLPETITLLNETSFSNSSVKNIYYAGSQEEWYETEGIEFINVPVHFNFVYSNEDDVPPEEIELTSIRRGDKKIAFECELPSDSDFHSLIISVEPEIKQEQLVMVSENRIAAVDLVNELLYTFKVSTQDIYGNISKGIEFSAEAGEIPAEGITEDGFSYAVSVNEGELSGTSYRIIDYRLPENKSVSENEKVTVAIPEKIHGIIVTEIADETFENFKEVNNLYIPKTISWIGNRTLSSCASLETVNVSAENKIYSTNIDGTVLYRRENNQKTVELVVPAVAGSVDFTGTQIIEVAANAFSGCKLITKVVLPNRLQRIGERAFENCSSLSKIVWPKTLREIGDNAFDGCEKLQYCYYAGTQKDAEKIVCDIQKNKILNSVITVFEYGK